jgi:hypothetical protein
VTVYTIFEGAFGSYLTFGWQSSNARPARHARSARDGLSMAEQASVGGAARTGRQTLMCQRQGNVALTGAHGGLGQGPVDDVALRVAAADLP